MPVAHLQSPTEPNRPPSPPPDRAGVRRRSFRRFLAYALDYKWLLVLAIGMGLGKFLVNYAFPWLLGTALDRVVAPPYPVPPESRWHWLELLVLLGAVFTVFHSVTTYARSYYTAKLGNRVIADLRQDLFDHLHQLSLHFYSKERTGSIVSRLISDISQAAQLVNGGVITVVMDSVQTLVGCALLFTMNAKLAAATLLVLPLYAVTFRRLNPRVKDAAWRVQAQLSKISGNVQERLAGIALVKTYAAEKRESERFRDDTEEHYDRVLEQTSLSAMVNAFSEGIVHLGQLIVIGFGGYLALTQTPPMTAGQLTKFMGTLAVMYLPVRRFAEINVVYQTSLAAIERVFQVFDITPKITERPDAVRQSPQRGEVAFERVNFDYHGDDSDESRVSLEERSHAGGGRGTGFQPVSAPSVMPDAESGVADQKHGLEARATRPRRWVLNDLSFRVPAGTRVALVGPSGSGKTTLVSLLPRLYDVTEGRILIDGHDVRDYALRPLRRSIGIVQQDSFLFSGTVRDNIAYGRPTATDEQVVAAAKAANAHDFITALPDGYASVLGERGVNLSGGQRQRMSIARAILKDPRILILDEATSALDSESEFLVQQALDRLMSGRTCFIIAHRLSTIRHADVILVMQAGRVVETGRHDDLVAAGGLYARLVRQQFGLTEDVKRDDRKHEARATPVA